MPTGKRIGGHHALRIPKAEVPGELGEALVQQLGSRPEPIEVDYNNPPVARANREYAAKLSTLAAVDANLKSFAHMAVAAQIGCSWCLDFGYFQAFNEQLDLAKASEVPRWRDSAAFTPLERAVLGYAEAMTQTPPTVTDEMAADLLGQLGEAAMVELTAFIALANLYARVNVALGIESEGVRWHRATSSRVAAAGRPTARLA